MFYVPHNIPVHNQAPASLVFDSAEKTIEFMRANQNTADQNPFASFCEFETQSDALQYVRIQRQSSLRRMGKLPADQKLWVVCGDHDHYGIFTDRASAGRVLKQTSNPHSKPVCRVITDMSIAVEFLQQFIASPLDDIREHVYNHFTSDHSAFHVNNPAVPAIGTVKSGETLHVTFGIAHEDDLVSIYLLAWPGNDFNQAKIHTVIRQENNTIPVSVFGILESLKLAKSWGYHTAIVHWCGFDYDYHVATIDNTEPELAYSMLRAANDTIRQPKHVAIGQPFNYTGLHYTTYIISRVDWNIIPEFTTGSDNTAPAAYNDIARELRELADSIDVHIVDDITPDNDKPDYVCEAEQQHFLGLEMEHVYSADLMQSAARLNLDQLLTYCRYATHNARQMAINSTIS